MKGNQDPEKDGDLPLVSQQAHRAFSLEGMCYSTECSSKDPDFNTGPPTPCPALAASFRVSPDRHSCVACLLMSKAPGGEGQVGPHLGEDTAGSLDPLWGEKTKQNKTGSQDRGRRVRDAPRDRFLANLMGLLSSETCAQNTEMSGHAPPLH